MAVHSRRAAIMLASSCDLSTSFESGSHKQKKRKEKENDLLLTRSERRRGSGAQQVSQVLGDWSHIPVP